MNGQLLRHFFCGEDIFSEFIPGNHLLFIFLNVDLLAQQLMDTVSVVVKCFIPSPQRVASKACGTTESYSKASWI